MPPKAHLRASCYALWFAYHRPLGQLPWSVIDGYSWYYRTSESVSVSAQWYVTTTVAGREWRSGLCGKFLRSLCIQELIPVPCQVHIYIHGPLSGVSSLELTLPIQWELGGRHNSQYSSTS